MSTCKRLNGPLRDTAAACFQIIYQTTCAEGQTSRRLIYCGRAMVPMSVFRLTLNRTNNFICACLFISGNSKIFDQPLDFNRKGEADKDNGWIDVIMYK